MPLNCSLLYRTVYVLVSLNGAVTGGQATHDNKQAPHATADAYIMPVMVTRWSFSFCSHGEVTFPAWEEAQPASSRCSGRLFN